MRDSKKQSSPVFAVGEKDAGIDTPTTEIEKACDADTQ
jgi:hypothetical protein